MDDRLANRDRPVVVFCSLAAAIEPIRAEFPELEVIDIVNGVPPGVEGDVLFGGHGAPSIEAVSRGVRWVQLSGTGLDNVTAEVLAVEQVTVARGGSAIGISEFVVTAMGNFVRDFPANWLHAPPERWHMQPSGVLAGARLALFGFGEIAQRIAKVALALEMSVVAQRRTPRPSPVPGVEMVEDFERLIDGADHLVLAAPGTESTHHVVNAESLGKMKRGVHLVNIARGSLVDQDALREALDEGIVARATLDVMDPEPLPVGHWLYEHPKVFLTPHSSWVGPPAFGRATELFFENMRRFLAGQPLEHLAHDGY
jgi:phosphoglycerate dehydrogenase-like enzyme